jgi:hypothetical protein
MESQLADQARLWKAEATHASSPIDSVSLSNQFQTNRQYLIFKPISTDITMFIIHFPLSTISISIDSHAIPTAPIQIQNFNAA